MAPQGAPSADDLLAQIRSMLDQYLALGSTTPVAPEAQQLADAIDKAIGGQGAGEGLGGYPGEPMGGGPPPGGPDVMPEVPPENQPGGAGAEPPPNTGAKTYKQANTTALDRLQKRNKKSSKAKA
jgi:hypothetical protein